MYDWLLFFHVLAAFMLVAGLAAYGVLLIEGGDVVRRVLARPAGALWNAGGLGVLVFGIWLALNVDGYELWDGWIIAALVLWAIATELGRRTREELRPAATGAGMAERSAVVRHWLRVAVVIAFVIVMVYKPGA